MLLKIFLKQIKNIFKSNSFLQWLELAVVAGLVFVYLTNRSVILLRQWLTYPAVDVWRLSAGILHGYVLLIFSSAPFVLLYLIPRQKELRLFYGQPLRRKDLYVVLGYYYHKYQILPLLLFLIPWFALSLISPPAGLLLLTGALLYSAVIFQLSFYLFFNSSGTRRFMFFMFYIIGIHTPVSVFLGFLFPGIFLGLFDFLFLIAVGLFLVKVGRTRPYVDLAGLYPLPKKNYLNKKTKPSVSAGLFFLPSNLQMLFKDYWLSVWRNPAYRRLKWITLVVYLAVLWLIWRQHPADAGLWLSLAGMALIYLHYSNYFNRKYVLPEPEWFFKTLPQHFVPVWLAKFLSESIFIFLLLTAHGLFLLFHGFNLAAQLNLLGLLLLFSLFTVSTMINFQILFYDQPRLAGYAYHFMMLFIVVLSLNYRLVGPLTALLLLGFYFIKAYKFFRT